MTDFETNLALLRLYHSRPHEHEISEGRDGRVDIRETEIQVYPYTWDPLRDWLQLGPLMERFSVCVVRTVNLRGELDSWRASILLDREAMADDQDVKRAICKAILAAHGYDTDKDDG